MPDHLTVIRARADGRDSPRPGRAVPEPGLVVATGLDDAVLMTRSPWPAHPGRGAIIWA